MIKKIGLLIILGVLTTPAEVLQVDLSIFGMD